MSRLMDLAVIFYSLVNNMTIVPFKKIQTDRVLGQVQSNIEASLTPIQKSLIIDGIFLPGIVLKSSDSNGTQINHLLGRNPNGYIVVNKNANSDVWQSDVQNTLSDKIIYLKCSADVTVSLWIF